VAHACIPALRRLRKQEHEFETSLDYSVRLCLKKQGLGCSLLIGCFARLRRALCPISSTARKKNRLLTLRIKLDIATGSKDIKNTIAIPQSPLYTKI
jgi:hypothetical protein